MKINQWTLGLAAVGVVSLASAVKADEAKMSALQTALSSTTISGYVDTSVEWGMNGIIGQAVHDTVPFRSGKTDGFNLNVVKLSLEKPMDESEWASGYKVDLLFGPDAVNYNTSANADGGGGLAGQWTSSDFAIKQAYVALRTPVGNGIDWKVGTFDTVIGYEVFESGSNPNFTRSWGYAVEPTQHTGILGSYRINDTVSVAAGVANTLTAGINDRANNAFAVGGWRKTYLASVAVTAPSDMGFLSGSTLYAGVVGGINALGATSIDQNNYYVGATLNTPVTNLKAGLALDSVANFNGIKNNDVWVAGAYLSYQATEKMSLNGRVEYGQADNFLGAKGHIYGLTGTVQYDLWANVLSRLEVRWDNVDSSNPLLTSQGATSVYANLIYKF